MNTKHSKVPKDFKVHIRFSVPAAHLFAAVATAEGASNWWTRQCEVGESAGGEASFRYPKVGFFAVMRIVHRESPRLLEWECIDSQHPASTGLSDLRDWTGTRIRFEIRPVDGNRSELDFTHFGLMDLECREICSGGWSFFLNDSLRGYLEKGKGQPLGGED